MRSVLGFVFGMVCIGVVAYILLDASRKDADITVTERVAPPPAAANTTATPAAAPSAAPIARRPAPATPAMPPPNATVAAPPTTLYLSRDASSDRYSPGGELDLTLTLTQDGGEPVRAMGIEEQLPAGWEFVGFTGDVKPDVHRVADGKLELAWFNIPPFPAKVSYRVRVPQDATGPKDFHGEALYRTTGDEMRTGDIVTPLEQGEPGATAPAAPAPAPESVAAAPAAAAPGAASPAVAPESAPAAPVVPPTANAAPVPEAAAAPAETPTEPKTAEPASETPVAETPADAAAPVASGGLALATTVSSPAYTPGDVVEVSVQMGYDGADAVTAVGLQAVVPDGWKFEGLSGGATPTISPDAGKTGVLEFAWIQPPQWPATFTYKLRVPETENVARELSTTAMYRTSGGQLTSNTATAALAPKTP